VTATTRYAEPDLTGRTFGYLTTIRTMPPAKHSGATRWLCYCECGEEIIVRAKLLRSGGRRHCGCRQQAAHTPDCTEALDAVVARVCEATGIEPPAITAQGGDRAACAARRLVAITLRDQGLSFPAIGKAMNRNHTSVMRMCSKSRREAQEILVERVGARADIEALEALSAGLPEPTGFKDIDRIIFDKAKDAMRLAPADKRESLWRAACRKMFRESFDRQITQLPWEFDELQTEDEAPTLPCQQVAPAVLAHAAPR